MSLLPLGILSSSGAGGANTALELIQSQVLSSYATAVTFSSIPSTYKHLQLRFAGKTTNNGYTLQFQFNGATSGYSWHTLSNYSTGAYSEASSSTSSIRLSNSFNDLGAPSTAILDLADYTNQNKYKTARIFYGANDNGSYNRVMLASGLYQSGAVISSITVLGNTGTFDYGSRFSLYGVKG